MFVCVCSARMVHLYYVVFQLSTCKNIQFLSPLFNRMWRVVDLVEVALAVVDSAATVRGVAQEGEEDHAPLEEAVVDSEVARGSTREEVAVIEGLKGYTQSAMPTNIYSPPPLTLSLSLPLSPSLSPSISCSSVKATEKREGGGAHNWGKADDVDVKYVCVRVSTVTCGL